jgi:hypothetical protein
MKRLRIVNWMWIVGILVLAHQSRCARADISIIGQAQAEQLGLKRSWFTQLPLDVSRSKITHLKVQAGLVLAVTDEGMLHVIDAETGALQWSFRIGRTRFLATGACADSAHVAVANVDTAYVLERATGNLIYERPLTGTPIPAGPALSRDWLMVPLVNGPIETYPLPFAKKTEAAKAPETPLAKGITASTEPAKDEFHEALKADYLSAPGRIIGEPSCWDDGVVWTGTSNQIYCHKFPKDKKGAEVFNTPVIDGVSTPVVRFPPYLYVGTDAGNLIAYDASKGDEKWRFAAGSPIHNAPVVIGSTVFVLPEDGGMYALHPLPDAAAKNDGRMFEQLWFSPEAMQFVSASPKRVYALDRKGQLIILDGKSGTRIGTLWLPQTVKAFTNSRSDRMYFYSDSGLVQCVHEAALAQPQMYLPPKDEPPKKGPAGPAKTTPAPTTPAAAAEPAPMGN